MKLDSVIIKNFRSIETARVTKCNGFNVLIGKNNSGKSNILSAIFAFFICLKGGNLASLVPPIGISTDFFKKNNSEILENIQPIEITQIFLLSQDEISSLKNAIIKETPQMKTAVDGITSSRLSATIRVNRSDSPFSFISKLSLVGEIVDGNECELEKVLLEVSNDAAFEFKGNLLDKKNLERNIEIVDRLLHNDPDDIRHILEMPERERPKYLEYRYTRYNDRVIFPELEAALRNAKDYDSFIKDLEHILHGAREKLVLSQAKELSKAITTFAGDELSIPDYISNLLTEISKLKVLNLTERREPIGEEEASRLLELKVRRGGSTTLREIQDTVSSLLGVNIDAFQGSPLSRRSGKVAELDVDNFLVQINGSGIREALRIILDAEFLHPDILLIEEPEAYLHPSLENSMMQYLKLKSVNCQIFITTHSTNFLDMAEMKNVYLVSKPDSTQIELLNLEEAEEKIPKELGIRLSSLFMYDKLIFVEGPSDENILREMALKLEFNLGQHNVGFIHMGGVRNFAYYATEETLSFLTKRRVQLRFLIDKDEKEQSYFNDLETKLKGKADINILSKRELENYLIKPRALREFIKYKQGLTGKINELPDLSIIGTDIDQCAEELKQFTINKRLFLYLFSPIYPSHDIDFEHSDESGIKKDASNDIERMISKLNEEKEKIEDIYNRQKKYVNDNWDAQKLSMIPGDILIDNICRKYGTRFNKAKDGARLAKLLVRDEIDMEIQDFLKKICMISFV